jgi:hypothetical protein
MDVSVKKVAVPLRIVWACVTDDLLVQYVISAPFYPGSKSLNRKEAAVALQKVDRFEHELGICKS